jgi:hypothetical protein
MPDLYPEIEPYAQGILEVTGGDLVYWEVCGNPRGKPAVVLHGGPGSGCTQWHRRLFDGNAAALRRFLEDIELNAAALTESHELMTLLPYLRSIPSDHSRSFR